MNEQNTPDWLNMRISTSSLKKAKEGTKAFAEYRLKPKEDRKGHFDFGNAMEIAAMDLFYGTNELESKLVLFDETEIFAQIEAENPKVSMHRATKTYKEWKAAYDATVGDRLSLNTTGPESMETINSLLELLKQDERIEYLEGNYQDAFEWECPFTGRKRYSRPDVYNPETGRILSIKTAAPSDFSKVMVSLDYWLQVVDEIQGAVLSGKMESVKHYDFLVFKKTAPLSVDFHSIPIGRLHLVELSQEKTIRRLAEELKEYAHPELIPYLGDKFKELKVPGYYK